MPHCGWAPCVEPLPSFWPHRGIALGAFVWFGKRGSPTRRPLLSRNAGTAEPVRVSPPEAVAYPLELQGCYKLTLLTVLAHHERLHMPTTNSRNMSLWEIRKPWRTSAFHFHQRSWKHF